ncbi:MAG: ABC transporter ATP-binding protein [Lachnospiraceae bacterium]|nr:ABC transporter ATP-binding protein [Lachnospiraceae bacterium]MBD5481973.1 ABC transporter ATP-binding protein [Lachnospiraceae bacterium]
MIECVELVKSYKKKRVVDNLSFSVKKGEVFAFLGSNGAGKTTTIKMILGLSKIDSGTVKISDGICVGYSPETPYFPPFLTGMETLLYYAGIQNIPKANRRAEALRLLETVGLEDSKTKVSRYSKGMLQRLALAQSLLGDPELLILDEPTAGLDALGRHDIIQLVTKLKSLGKTIIVNSHILNDIERICDRGIIIKNGRKMGEWNRSDDNQRSLEDMFIEFVGGERNDDSIDRV